MSTYFELVTVALVNAEAKLPEGVGGAPWVWGAIRIPFTVTSCIPNKKLHIYFFNFLTVSVPVYGSSLARDDPRAGRVSRPGPALRRATYISYTATP